MTDRPRITSLPPDAITEWVSRDPDGYYAAVAQDARDMVQAQAAARWEGMTCREKLAEFWHDCDWLARAAFFGGVPAALLMMAAVVTWAVIV